MTAKNAPGKHFRKGISLLDAMREFGDDEKANAWFVSQRWPNGIECVQCGSLKVVTAQQRTQDAPVPLQRVQG